MRRYFLEVAYNGTHYSGFQKQENALTIQSEIERAIATLQRQPIALTGSSRTDTGVHALQNYFHFDFENDLHPQFVYKLNAILPPDIAVKNVIAVPGSAHCRFDATSREYEYRIYRFKNPFLKDVALYYPYKLDFQLMSAAADELKHQTNFFAFSKTNTQVTNFNCRIYKSYWIEEGETLVYTIEGNRFLRGMVRLLTASLLKLGRHQLSQEQFMSLFHSDSKCGYSVPAMGLYLKAVSYPANYFSFTGGALANV